jgi:hypothetical protein
MAFLMAAAAVVPVAVVGPNPGQVVDRLFDTYRDGSADGMLAVYAADATFEDINQRHLFTGTEQLQAMLSGIVGLHLRMDLEEKRRVVHGDMVVVEYEYRGQLNGAALGASVGKEGSANQRLFDSSPFPVYEEYEECSELKAQDTARSHGTRISQAWAHRLGCVRRLANSIRRNAIQK